MKWCALMASLALASACKDDRPTLERSCAGETVTNCLPYEYAEVTSANVSPDGLDLDAIGETLTLHVEFERCPDAPRNHIVPVVMRVGGDGDPDAGEGSRLIEIITLRDNGADGDAVAGDGVIDATVENPFFGVLGIPPNENVSLRFQTRMPADCSSGTCIGGTCQSEHLEIPYRTGSRTM